MPLVNGQIRSVVFEMSFVADGLWGRKRGSSQEQLRFESRPSPTTSAAIIFAWWRLIELHLERSLLASDDSRLSPNEIFGKGFARGEFELRFVWPLTLPDIRS